MTSVAPSSPIDSSQQSPSGNQVESVSEIKPRVNVEDDLDGTLHQAARDGNIDLMNKLIEELKELTEDDKKEKINMKDEDQMTPLHYAARYNHYETVKLLVKNGANVNATGEDNITALHLSARYKKPESETDSVIQYLESKKADVNAQDEYGSTALHYAAIKGNAATMRELLKCEGIEAKAADKEKITALHLACSHGNEECCRLLKEEAKVNLRCLSEERRTPLHFASMEGHLNICEMLVDDTTKREMLTDKDFEGNTALHLAVKNGHLGIVKFCLNKGSVVNARDQNSRTPLHLAAALRKKDVVQALLDKEARVNVLDKSGTSPLHIACMYNRKDAAECLLGKGAKIERCDRDNFTPLLIAACYGHSEIIKCLLHKGAKMSKTDKNDKTAIYWTAEENKLDALKALIEHIPEDGKRYKLEESDKYDNTPLHVAAQNGYVSIVEALLEAGASIDPRNDEEQTPLHLAAKHGRTRTVRELVKSDQLIINDKDEKSNTPLHLAASEGHNKTLQALLDIGADIQARNCNSWTPLDCAADGGWVKTSRALLEADSPVDPADKNKTTPLHLASKNGHVDVVKLLLQWNADLSLRDKDGKNCLDIAIDNNKKDVAMAIINNDNWKTAMKNGTTRSSNEEEEQGEEQDESESPSENAREGEETATGRTEIDVKNAARDNINENDETNDETGIYDTPMRKLIRKMPEVAVQVLQRCTKPNDKNKEHHEYEETFEYDFMDDMFTDWRPNSKIPSNPDCVYETNGTLKKDAKPYSKDARVLKDNHPLMIMVRSKRVDLLGHPLCFYLLRHKWNKYGRWMYYTSLLMYCLFLAALTGYILMMPPPYYYYEYPNGTKVWYLDGEEKFNIADPNNLTLSPAVDIFKWTVVVLAVFSMIKEIIQMFTKRFDYIDLENLIEWTIYILAMLIVIDFTSEQRSERWREPWQWKCAAICIFLAWMNLIVFIRKLPHLGIYVVMFIDVLWTFLKFSIVLLLFIVAFGLAFYVLLMNQEPFYSPYLTLVKTFVMMIGEFEYDTIFFGDEYLRGETPDITSDEYFAHTVWYSEVTYVLFVLFLVIMAIIIMNLLIGLAVDDIKGVQEQAVLKRYAMQVELALEVEHTILSFIQKHRILRRIKKKLFIRKETIKPNYEDKNPITRWYTSWAATSATSSKSVAKALRPHMESFDEVLEKQEALTTTVKALQKQIRRIERMLVNLLQEKGDPYEEEDGMDDFK